MNKYIPSLRLRTLPLSMSGIILGTGLAYHNSFFPLGAEAGIRFWFIFGLSICTTLSLQILSNLSNELGDALKGTDAAQTGREAYGLQAGTVTIAEIRRLIVLFIGLSVLFGTSLVLTAFLRSPLSDVRSAFTNIVLFLAFGALAIVGAMTYTLGKHSYGYIGLGDLGVFLFFGLLSTMGAYYLQTQTLSVEATLASVAIGLPCVGVLNLNNVRDMTNDRAHGKRTFASLLGQKGAKIYHIALLAGSLVLFACIGHLWALLIAPVWAWHIIYIFRHDGHDLDKQMPVLMFSTLITAILACI